MNWREWVFTVTVVLLGLDVWRLNGRVTEMQALVGNSTELVANVLKLTNSHQQQIDILLETLQSQGRILKVLAER